MLVITIESPHRTLKISSAGPRLCEWTGDGCRVPSAGPISSWTHNLAHLTSHHLHIKTLRLLSARPRIRSPAGWSLVSGQVRVTCPLIGQEASHWSQDQAGVLTDGSDGSVQQLVQDEPPKFV